MNPSQNNTTLGQAGRHNPLVSVVCSFLNEEAFLAEAIDSVLQQSLQDFELLLVDDGSTDRSTQIAKDYAANAPTQVRYLEHADHANRGLSASRNVGIKAARGEYVALIDADDVWMPDKLEQQVAVLRTHACVDMVCGAVEYWHSWNGRKDVVIPTGHSTDAVIMPPQASVNVYPLGTAAAPCPSDMLLRKSAVDAVGGFEEHFTGDKMLYEDQGFLAKLYVTSPVFFSSKVWLKYRRHPDSCVAQVTRDGQYHQVRRYFLEWFEAYAGEHPELDPRIPKAIKQALRRNRWSSTAAVVNSSRRALSRVWRVLKGRPQESE